MANRKGQEKPTGGRQRAPHPPFDTVFVQGDMMLITVMREGIASIVDVGKKKRRKKAIIASPQGLEGGCRLESRQKDRWRGIRFSRA